jgi:hypothetical protein
VLLPDPKTACLRERVTKPQSTHVGEEELGREPAAVAGTLPCGQPQLEGDKGL